MNVRRIIKEVISEILQEGAQLKKAAFNELPFDYQRGLMTYMISGEPVEWDENTPGPEGVDWFNHKQVQHLINQYSLVHGDKVFEYGFMPTEEIIKDVMNSMDDWDNWNEYHKWYRSTQGGSVEHGDSVFPIILSSNSDLSNGAEFIEDGWHRFHSYVAKGMKQIPVVKFT